MDWTAVELDKGDPIPPLEGYDVLWVMGGPMDVWDVEEHPWLVEEKRAIRKWVREMERPFLGLCLGHQLLADALGGTCGPQRPPEIGVSRVDLTDEGRGGSHLPSDGREPGRVAVAFRAGGPATRRRGGPGEFAGLPGTGHAGGSTSMVDAVPRGGGGGHGMQLGCGRRLPHRSGDPSRSPRCRDAGRRRPMPHDGLRNHRPDAVLELHARRPKRARVAILMAGHPWITRRRGFSIP